MNQRSVKELMEILPQVGKLEWIGLRSERRGAILQPKTVQVLAGLGLEGDRRIKNKKVDMTAKRQVTLVQSEHLKVLAAILAKESIDPELLRRNLVVSGINLNALKDKVFSIDGVVFQGTGYCHPCSRMEENLGEGGYNAMRGHGGITARALTSGPISIGNSVSYSKELEEKYATLLSTEKTEVNA